MSCILYGHKRSHHNAVEICTKRFSTNNAKEEHEASVHMGEKRLPCHLCDQRFTRAAFYMGTRGATTTQWKSAQKCFLQIMRKKSTRPVFTWVKRDCHATYVTRGSRELHFIWAQEEPPQRSGNLHKKVFYK